MIQRPKHNGSALGCCILLYGAKTWTMTKTMNSEIDGIYTRVLCHDLNINWRRHVTNENLFSGVRNYVDVSFGNVAVAPALSSTVCQTPTHQDGTDQIQLFHENHSDTAKRYLLKETYSKIESLIKRMRWKASFYERKDDYTSTPDDNNSFGFKSRKCPPRIEDLESFETDMLKMIKQIEFKKEYSTFQHELRNDTIKIKNSTKAFIPADKTTNYYELDKKTHDRLLMNSITSTYGKADGNTINIINNEARIIATDLNIQDRVERMAEQQAFITLKDHKDNFENKPTCRLINPAKSEIGRISNKILTNINTTIRTKTSLNQWKNSLSVIDWFSNIPDKKRPQIHYIRH